MRLRSSKAGTRKEGWALLVVMSLAATSMLVMASVMNWANENSMVVARNNEYFTTTYAAEAATEKVLGAMVQDDQNYGEGLVFSQTSYYSSLLPGANDSVPPGYWTNYQFSGGTTNNIVIVEKVGAVTNVSLGPPYSGLNSQGATYEIIANAQDMSSPYGIISTVGQQIIFLQIPIFQFAIFYNDTMEVDPGATMNVNGLVHGNTNIYLDPNSGVPLTFSNDVSGSGNIYLSENPSDPTTTRPANSTTVTFDGQHLSGVNPLLLPVGTNISGNTTNVAQNVDAILQLPPAGESPNSSTGTNRLYNQADMIITISNGNVITVTSGVLPNNMATTISNNQWSLFVNTNNSFYDLRESPAGTIPVDPLNIDVGKLRQWSATNTTLRPVLASIRPSEPDVQSIFVADMRSTSNMVITTNITYATNTSTVTVTGYQNFPAANTYEPPVTTNTMTTTSGTFPPANSYVVPPAITTNFTVVTNSTRPTSNYVGTITTNGSGSGKTYTYDQITGYIYGGVTGYTYSEITGVTTNTIYTTNYIQFAMPGIVLTNGASLPSNGLSIVTPDPAYIEGNWNVYSNNSTSTAGSGTVAGTLPSAIYADAITILSPAWNPNNSTASISSTSSRNASTDTVNAAFMTGNVPSNGNYYSGGVENFPRFLENWSGQTFWYSGSMVEMFSSQIANAPWPGTGTVYNPPTRNWAFDTNFNNANNLPPLTPHVMYLNRAKWTTLPPRTTQF
ncbi:MAG: hypothetical protein ABSG59_03845 [Verrucomicrobiota bacterium]|jgi:hypothetical protein